MKRQISILILCMVMVLSGINLIPFGMENVGAETWTQSTTEDFESGESFFVEVDDDTIELSRGLNCQWTFIGEQDSDFLGHAASTIGDINGDGYDDILIGAYRNSGSRGKVYLFFGSENGISSVPDGTSIGEYTNSWFGYSLGRAGDVNGDGYDDIIIGAPRNNSYHGKVYVYHGSAIGPSQEPDWSVEGEVTGSYFGDSVASAGDVNGDGYDDVIIGALRYDDGFNTQAGKAHLYYGSATGLSKINAWNGTGKNTRMYFGCSVASAGDVNSDGFDDIIIGEYGYNTWRGRAHVFYGSSSGLNTYSDWNISGTTLGRLGYSVASSGDVNGDGYDDIIAGAPYTNSLRGKTYVYYGSSTGLENDFDWSMDGEYAQDLYGWSAASAGDINNDGYDEVIIGAYGYNNDRDQGKVYIYHGTANGLTEIPIWTEVGENSHESINDQFGYFVSSAGDIDCDGFDEVLIGARFNDDFDTNTGKAYLYQYQDEVQLPVLPTWKSRGELAAQGFSTAIDSAGDVNGDGFDDLIVGAYAYNNLGPYQGAAYVYYGSINGMGDDYDWKQVGESADDRFGESVACAGDVNGDGFDDVIVGAYEYNSGYGKAYVYHGSRFGISSSNDWNATGEYSGERFGHSVASAGDVNGDGYDDVIIGAPRNNSNTGRVLAYYGSKAGLSQTADWIENGSAAWDWFGLSLDSAGDIDNNGYDDIIIGAQYWDGASWNNIGRVYIYNGSSTGLSSGWGFRGEFNYDNFGISVAGAGDVNGDGYDDVLIGADSNDDGGNYAGKAYLYYGPNLGPNSSKNWTFIGEGEEDQLGYIVAAAGDVDNDGYDDIVISAYGNDTYKGKAYFFFGSSLGVSSNPSWVGSGIVDYDRYAGGLGTGGDFNNDGYSDIIVGASTRESHGEAYIYSIPDFFEYGSIESDIFSAPDDKGLRWKGFNWEPHSQPLGTSVKFQIGTSSDGITWQYLGPDGTSDSYYTNPLGNTIFSEQFGRFWRFKAFLFKTNQTSKTPAINEVNIYFDYYDIIEPNVRLTSPNGGEDWMKGKHYPITWEAEGEFNETPANLFFSWDNGANWSFIEVLYPNYGFYNWTVPDIETASALIAVTVIDIYGNEAGDLSDASFAIDPPPPGAGGVPAGGESGSGENVEPPDTSEETENNLNDQKDEKTSADHSILISAISIILLVSIIINIFLLTKRKNTKNSKTPSKKNDPKQKIIKTKLKPKK